METAQQLRISIVQADIAWEDTHANLAHFDSLLTTLPPTDVVLLPEMFSTAFSSNAQALAEPTNGTTMQTVLGWAKKYQCAFIGSFIAVEQGKYYNRGFLVEPNGTTHFYDKRHLFIGGEETYFTPGQAPLIVSYKGWNIALCICYDLRFPIWSRNRGDYDMIIYVASWPTPRVEAWKALLTARAIENQCYVAGVNRVGCDPSNEYSGGSRLIDPYGNIISACEDGVQTTASAEIDMVLLDAFREKFPVLNDSDLS